MMKQFALIAFVFLFFYTGNHILFGENRGSERELLHWFDDAPEAGRYREIKPDLQAVFREADDADIPGGLLLGKVKEGAAKRVPPSRLLHAIRLEKERFQTGLEIIKNAGYSPAEKGEELGRHLKLLGIILREGTAETFLEELLRGARTNGLALAQGISACSAVFQVQKITSLPEEDLLRLGKALFESSLPPSGYDSLPSFFLKGQVNRISERDILEIALRVFENGGGLIQLERELSRRMRKR